MKKGILFIGVMLLSVFLCGCKEKIDLNGYLDIDADGYDTVGTASFSIDYEDIYEDYEEIFDKGAKGEFEELMEEFGIELLLEEAISGELSETSGLSNGDEIEFEWDVNAQDIEENLKRGILEMLILKILMHEDMYGYQMASIINEKSEDKINIKEGSLYGPLYRMIDKGYISERKVLVGKRRTRIYYHIESNGVDYLYTLIKIYNRMNEGVSLILNQKSNGDIFDE